jgi:modulator of FtsH protease
MEGWTDFYVAEVGASAALAGLLFVAVSINLAQIMKFPLLPGRAAQTLTIVGAALVIASLALLPGQSHGMFGIETVVCGLFVLFIGLRQFRAAVQRREAGDPWTWTVIPIGVLCASALPETIGGLLLVAGSDSGLYWVATGVIVSFIATLQNGWVLLIEILR